LLRYPFTVTVVLRFTFVHIARWLSTRLRSLFSYDLITLRCCWLFTVYVRLRSRLRVYYGYVDTHVRCYAFTLYVVLIYGCYVYTLFTLDYVCYVVALLLLLRWLVVVVGCCCFRLHVTVYYVGYTIYVCYRCCTFTFCCLLRWFTFTPFVTVRLHTPYARFTHTHTFGCDTLHTPHRYYTLVTTRLRYTFTDGYVATFATLHTYVWLVYVYLHTTTTRTVTTFDVALLLFDWLRSRTLHRLHTFVTVVVYRLPVTLPFGFVVWFVFTLLRLHVTLRLFTLRLLRLPVTLVVVTFCGYVRLRFVYVVRLVGYTFTRTVTRYTFVTLHRLRLRCLVTFTFGYVYRCTLHVVVLRLRCLLYRLHTHYGFAVTVVTVTHGCVVTFTR